MEKFGKVLIVDDNEDVLKAARIFLKRHFQYVVTETNPELLSGLMQQSDYDIILLDMNFTKDVNSGKEGFYWLSRIFEINPEQVVVLMTAYGDIQMAVEAVKKGATNFVLKPWNNEKLLATLQTSLILKQNKEELQFSKSTLSVEPKTTKFEGIIGSSPSMLKVFSLIEKVAKTDANILILGENGTGKELIAKAVHSQSNRKNEVFVSVDLGALTENLFESELFGHKKGAFTDAKEDREGRFELASKGTLFLDEIGNLSQPLQSKLLSVIQNRKVSKVGSNKEIDIDIRLVCATNMDLYEMVEQKEFRQDLLYRINTIEIHLPPLRARMEDIPLLADYFLKKYAPKYNPIVTHISNAAISKLKSHDWPGNIRELQHAMERAVIMGTSNSLSPDDFILMQNKGDTRKSETPEIEGLKIQEIEKLLIIKTLERYEWNITKAANELGLTRTSLYRRIEKHGL